MENGAKGTSDMHGTAARVAESEAGAERMNRGLRMARRERTSGVKDLRSRISRVCQGAGSGTGAAPLCAMDSKTGRQYTLPDSGNPWN